MENKTNNSKFDYVVIIREFELFGLKHSFKQINLLA